MKVRNGSRPALQRRPVKVRSLSRSGRSVSFPISAYNIKGYLRPRQLKQRDEGQERVTSCPSASPCKGPLTEQKRTFGLLSDLSLQYQRLSKAKAAQTKR